MKKLIFTLSLFCLIAAQSNAQQCTTGTSNCTVVILPKPGLSPVSDSLPPVIDEVPNSTTINFQNFDTISFGGHTLTIDSLHIDTISNLPSGLCWATSSPDNTFANQQNGCIQVTGTTNAIPGQYKLHIYVHAYVPFGIGTTADAAGLKYYVRVNCSDSAAVVPVDTTQIDSDAILPYASQAHCNTAVKSIDGNIQAMSVYPNPFNSQAVVTFTSMKAATMTERITTVIGSEVYSNEMNVVAGINTHVINRNNLSAGVYFYTISDGTTTFTKRLIVE